MTDNKTTDNTIQLPSPAASAEGKGPGKGARRYVTASPDIYSILKDNAHSNRTCMTDAESFLWEHIRRKALGVKFRRQVPIGDYIVDFLDPKTKLIIEVDGEYHNSEEQRENDIIRTNYLNKHGYYVLRFTNNDVLGDIDYVLERINTLLDKILENK